ncbi:hypothetical protein GCM10027039_41970 [Terrabacter koreensis]
MRGLVIPVSDLRAARAMYTALLGAPHTDESSCGGYNIDGFEAPLNPADHGGGPVTLADAEDLDALHDTMLAAGTTERDTRVRSHQRRGTVCSPTGTAHPPMCVEGGSPVTPGHRRLAPASSRPASVAIPRGDTETPDRARERSTFNVE